MNQLNVLGGKPRQALHLYWQRLIPIVGEAAALHIARVADEAIRVHPTPQRELGEIQKHWYASIAAGAPDYGVYSLPIYLAEVWYCWATYSRKYLRQIADLKLVQGFERIVDLGCGTGYSTAALQQMAPHAQVIGTNVLEGSQGEFCLSMAEMYGFRLRANVAEVGHQDVVFASEYFEHFLAPIDHLREVLQHCSPRMLIIANTFTSPSIGHFPAYSVEGVMVDGATASRAFNAELVRAGYRARKDLSIWNNRPAVWTLQP